MNNFWEMEVYRKQKQWNLYPYPEVLYTLKILRQENKNLGDRILEIGSGVGNNLIPIAKLGMDCYGIDISKTAVEGAQIRAQHEGLKINFSLGDVQKLNFGDNSFDYVLDRSVLTCTPEEVLQNSVLEIYRVLKPGGVFFAFDWFGINHPDLKFGEKGSSRSFGDFTAGKFVNISCISAFDHNSLFALLANFKKIETFKVVTTDNYKAIIEEKFNFIALK